MPDRVPPDRPSEFPPERPAGERPAANSSATNCSATNCSGEIPSDEVICEQVAGWIRDVVVGLNLCPFAGPVWRGERIRLTVSRSTTPDELLFDLATEIARLDSTPPSELETTLVIIPQQLADFEEYNEFLDAVDDLLRQLDREGVYQAASFHPGYLFAEAEPDDQANATNRSPWPIIHLLREESISEVVDSGYEVDAIPEANILRLRGMSREEWQRLFPWLTPPGGQPKRDS